MKLKNKIDILLIARPDQSLDIYNSLIRDKQLSCLYITFKLFPKWIFKLFHFKKLRTIEGRNYKISYMTTFLNLLKFNFGIKCLSNCNENYWIEKITRKIINKNQIKIVHYWPKYCHGNIITTIKSKGIFTIADIHMPNPIYIIDKMKNVYKKYGIETNNTFLAKYVEEIKSHLENENNVMVPSTFVVETMKYSFPDKNYYVVPYGITVYPKYRKKRYILNNSEIKNFVYAGQISIEKGCDILLDWFSANPDYIIHLYGLINNHQQWIFEKYSSKSNIIFHGTCPKSILQDELVQYDIGIHLSRFDAYSISVGEMIGCGLPVIVSEQTGIKDEVIKYGFGIVTPLSFLDISKQIKVVLSPEIYNQCIKNIDDYIKSNYKDFGHRMEMFYKSIILK